MENSQTAQTAPPWGYLISAVSILFVFRLLPWVSAPLPLYGYDYGFYLYAFFHQGNRVWSCYFPAVCGGFNNPLITVAQKIHLPPELFITFTYLFFTLLLGWSLYRFFKRHSWQAGVAAVFLFACSAVQIEAYTMFLWKETVAIPFFILFLVFLEEKNWKGAALCWLAVFLTHRTTSIFLIIFLTAFILYEQIRRRLWRWLALEILIGSMAAAKIFPVFYPLLHKLVSDPTYKVQTGLFLNNTNPLSLLWPVLILAVPGIYLSLKRGEHKLLFLVVLITSLWYCLKLPFYLRVLIYVDLALILYGAYFLAEIWKSRFRNIWIKLAVIVLLLAVFLKGGNYLLGKTPLITPQEIAEISNFNPPEGFVLGVSSQDAPWLAGYLRDRQFATPGLFSDLHSEDEWLRFWHGENQTHFLAAYPRPLYLYERNFFIHGEVVRHLKQISPNFFYYTDGDESQP